MLPAAMCEASALQPRAPGDSQRLSDDPLMSCATRVLRTKAATAFLVSARAAATAPSFGDVRTCQTLRQFERRPPNAYSDDRDRDPAIHRGGLLSLKHKREPGLLPTAIRTTTAGTALADPRVD